jgi:hypothetical protein
MGGPHQTDLDLGRICLRALAHCRLRSWLIYRCIVRRTRHQASGDAKNASGVRALTTKDRDIGDGAERSLETGMGQSMIHTR